VYSVLASKLCPRYTGNIVLGITKSNWPLRYAATGPRLCWIMAKPVVYSSPKISLELACQRTTSVFFSLCHKDTFNQSFDIQVWFLPPLIDLCRLIQTLDIHKTLTMDSNTSKAIYEVLIWWEMRPRQFLIRKHRYFRICILRQVWDLTTQVQMSDWIPIWLQIDIISREMGHTVIMWPCDQMAGYFLQ
jgi:hypothetical protein